MSYQQIFDAEGDGSQDEGTLFSLSGEYLEAARVLQSTPPVRTNYSTATYYLLGHSAELMIKAYLYKHGSSISVLKKINHDLEKLSVLAREAFLPETVKLDQIRLLAPVYKEKFFEYRTRKKNHLPSIDLLAEEIEKLQSAVFDKVWVWGTQ